MRTAAAVLVPLLCLIQAPPLSAAEAEPARRNVLLLVADDLGLDLGCYGNTKIRTPSLDGLADDGVRFSQAFATVSSCSPSRASLLTGLYTHTSGQYGLAHAEHNFHTRDNVKSLPGVLKQAGYHTGIIGKVHVLPKSVYDFDEEITEGLGANRNVAGIARAAQKFFSDSGERPFLLVVGFGDPHRSARGFANDQAYPGVKETRYDPKDVLLPYFLPDRPEVREELAEYYQASSRMDLGVGMVLDALKSTKNADNTLVLFVSDNGIPFPGAKTTLYDSGLHLPLIVSSPLQKKRGLVNNALASFVDVMPTALDWAGVKAPPLPGRSLLPILEEENPQGWEVVYGSHQFHEVTMYYPIRMVRTRQHKYLLNLAHQLDYPFASDLYNSRTWQGILERQDKMLGQRSIEAYVHRPREELYDLEKDPNELKNVANDPAYAEVLADLRKRCREWQEKTKDPWVVKYKYE
jgi:N-sulfoglucosamine sulfohydrolase